MASEANLEQIQRWFHAAISHPGGVRHGLASDLAKQALPAAQRDLESVVLPSNALDSVERLSIYANMYVERLLDVLAEEFPSVCHLLGPRVFSEVARRYIAEHPPTHYSLVHLGRRFPGFLLRDAAGTATRHRGFVAAIATVERAMEDVFDAQQVQALPYDELSAIPPDSWNRLRLHLIPALQLLTLSYPVNAYITAVRNHGNTEIPAAGRSWSVVYRHDYRVWRMDLDEHQFVLLSGLNDGLTLSDALVKCAELPGSHPEEFATSLHHWFRDWTAEGLFCEISVL